MNTNEIKKISNSKYYEMRTQGVSHATAMAAVVEMVIELVTEEAFKEAKAVIQSAKEEREGA